MSELARKSRSFYEIADDLAAYFETVAMDEALLAALDSGEDEQRRELESNLAEMRAEIGRLGAELATKADNVAGVIHRQGTEIDALKAAAERTNRRRKAIEAARDWLKGYVMEVMRATNQRMIRTTETTLRIQGNGGKQPLVVDQWDSEERKWRGPSALPARFLTVTVRMPEEHYARVAGLAGVEVVAREPDNEKIRAELAELCEECHGSDGLCKECHGTGKTEVQGAHLEARGEHLRIS